MKGKNIGKRRTPETTLILNTSTGIFYLGYKNASESINMSNCKLRRNLCINKKNNTPFIYA